MNPSGLADGIYTGSITVPTSAGNGSISLTLVVVSGGGEYPVRHSSRITFVLLPGARSQPEPRAGAVCRRDRVGGNFTATVDQTWMSLTGSSGTSPGKIGVYVSPGTLTAGSYNGNVIITGAGNAVTRVPVSLAITASGSPVLGSFPRVMR